MQEPYKIMLLFGTRAEALKLAPIIKLMQKSPVIWQPIIVTTAQQQHHQILQQTMNELQIEVAFNLDVANNSEVNLVEQLSQLLHTLNNVINAGQPDMLMVAGDGITSVAAGLVGFYHRLSLGHVEAGLRTHNKNYPFPDEMHRLLTDDLADLYFAPTSRSRDNLLAEHHPAERIYVTGNTSVDAVQQCLTTDFDLPILKQIPTDHQIIILTIQRLETIGEPMREVFRTVRDIVETNPNVELIYPVMPQPAVMTMAEEILGNQARIHLINPLPHRDFLNLAARSTLIITDSGTIQEEAPALHKPVLLLRDNTERQEAVDVGAVKVVGTDPTSIQQAVFDLLNHPHVYRRMANAENPFGDGHASEQILQITANYLAKE